MPNRYDVNYEKPPVVGTELAVMGQRYRLIRREPYMRRDGEWSAVLTWEAYCCECGNPFETKSGLRAKELHRRCRKHREAGLRVQWTDAAIARRAEHEERRAAAAKRWEERRPEREALRAGLRAKQEAKRHPKRWEPPRQAEPSA